MNASIADTMCNISDTYTFTPMIIYGQDFTVSLILKVIIGIGIKL